MAYIAVLTFIKMKLGEHRILRVICDFEPAEQNAWVIVFGVHVQGCLYHVCAVSKFHFLLQHCDI